MIKEISAFLLCLLPGLHGFTATASRVSDKNVRVFEDMAPYVYPANRAATVACPAFMADGLHYLALSANGKKIVKYATRTGAEIEVVLDLDNTRENKIEAMTDFTLSPDGSKILVVTAEEPVYRRSTRASHYIYELRTRLLRPLSEKFAKQRSPLFSPDGRIVAFVGDDNNIYLKKTDYNTEVAVTTDGAIDKVINGVPDWVYEEEFTTTCSMAWAPDNMTLCYLKYSEAEVPAYSFTLYEGSCEPRPEYALYPGSFTYKYPVAGEPNSKVTLHSYDVDNRKTKDLTLPDTGIEYIPRIAYGGASASRLMAVTLDRSQTRMEIYSINPRSGVSKSVMTEEERAWLSPLSYEDITFGTDGFVVLSSRSGYTHAYLYSYAGSMTRQITSGEYDVTAYYGADAKGSHYYQSTSTGAVNRVISKVDVKGVVKNLSSDKGFSSAWFSPSLNFMGLTYSNTATPPVVTLYEGEKKLRVLEDNASLKSVYASMPVTEFTTITTSEGVKLNAYIIKPTGFDASRRYPLIIHQYSGPGSQEVLDRWKPDWTHYAAMKGYVVMCVDPRGTGGRGREWETAVYKNLGHYETIDLQGAAEQAGKLPYIDPSRIGICGWSYGGYETLMAVTSGRASSVFACAVSIAPVTDWRFYDTVYAERYMLTPRENPDGYRTSAPLNYAGNLSIPLLIMHGTADDNVHLMNTMQYVSVMQSEGRFCDMFFYPNMNHSIFGCDARLNVYSKMLDYFNKNL